ncbi:MAG: hypothetical protein ACRCRT_04155 [Cetobacterium somerae]
MLKAYVKKSIEVTEEDLQDYGIIYKAHVLMLNDLVFKNAMAGIEVEKINMNNFDVYEIEPNDRQLRLSNNMIAMVMEHNKEFGDRSIKNHCDNGKKWLKSIYDKDVVIENTDYTHQTALGGKEDYTKWEKIKVQEYLIPIQTKLVVHSKRV